MLKASICISAFNKPHLIGKTLDSIFRQSPPFEFEVIVVDDGSKDASVFKAVKNYPVLCHRIEREPVFRNPCIGRNTAYKLAQSDILICQSDEVLHVKQDTIENLVKELVEGTFVIANVLCLDKQDKICGYFTGPKRPVPFFFLGSIFRKDLFAIGGNDEEFIISPAWEDVWFGDCLIRGLGLKPNYTTKILGYHQWHEYYTKPENEHASKNLYERKKAAAEREEIPWWSTFGPWPFIPFKEEVKDNKGIKRIFQEVYRKEIWGKNESVSGTGSSLKATKKLREELPYLLSEFCIRSILDIPCGDFNWMSQLDLGDISYIGADIVDEIVEQNKKRYDKDFRILDLASSELPRSDLILCRDCLQHFSLVDFQFAMDNITGSKCKYLLATTFTNRLRNRLVKTGDWSPYNLQIAPFNFPKPLQLINENCEEWYPHFQDKCMGLWRVSDL
jgi:glycosyltransferase involved in cell wall biosynthesis